MLKSLNVKDSHDNYPAVTASIGKAEKPKARYPYGTALTINGQLLKKFPELKDANAGDEFTIKGECRVKMVRMIDDADSDHYDDSQIEMQITGLEFTKSEEDLDKAFNED